MRVICIDDRFMGKDGFEPRCGEIVTVAGCCPVYKNNYDIKEYPRDKRGALQSFDKNAFVPLSSIDETEFERNYNKELV